MINIKRASDEHEFRKQQKQLFAGMSDLSEN